MIKGSEQKQIEAIGSLKAALSALEGCPQLKSAEARDARRAAITKTKKAILRQWSYNEQFVIEDDT